jgi:chemotaxis protein MotB
MPPSSLRRNRRRYDSNINHERWLISYADFVTLLFAFFTTMYAISTVDAKKLQDMVESMQAAFDANKLPTPRKTASDPAKPLKVPTPDQQALEALKVRLAQRLKLQIAGGQVGLEVDPRGLVVTIREAGTFGVGSAELSDAAKGVLGEVADALADVDHPVRIEGHTDDVPIRTAKYKSNWELSTARATNVVSFFVEERGLPPSRFSAAGYGEFRPRAANTTGANRAANRRVDIVILNEATRRAEEPAAPTDAAAPEAGAGAGAGAGAAPAASPSGHDAAAGDDAAPAGNDAAPAEGPAAAPEPESAQPATVQPEAVQPEAVHPAAASPAALP